MITFFDLLRTYDIDTSEVRLVRHGNKEIDVLKTYLYEAEKFTEYTAWQKTGKYGKSKYLAIFAPARGTTSLFLGLWQISGVTENKDLLPKHRKLLEKFSLPSEWFGTADRYSLEITGAMADLTQRLVVDWGKSTVSWVQTKIKTLLK